MKFRCDTLTLRILDTGSTRRASLALADGPMISTPRFTSSLTRNIERVSVIGNHYYTYLVSGCHLLVSQFVSQSENPWLAAWYMSVTNMRLKVASSSFLTGMYVTFHQPRSPFTRDGKQKDMILRDFFSSISRLVTRVNRSTTSDLW